MQQVQTKRKRLIQILVVVVILILIKFLIPVVSIGGLRSLIEDWGIFGPIIVIFFYILAHVVAPIAGSPAMIISIALFGMWPSMLYVYIAETISSIINFYISRKFGRRWVVKLVGKKTMADIDDFTQVFGTQVLIIGRIFGFALFDIISYAAGLTNISFKKYYAATLVFATLPLIVFGFAFGNLDFNSTSGLIITAAALVSAGLIFTYFVKRYIKKSKSKKINYEN